MELNALKILLGTAFITVTSGLYPSISKKGSYDAIKSMTNFIAYADGKHDLIWIADKIHVPASELYEIKDKLLAHDLLEEIEG